MIATKAHAPRSHALSPESITASCERLDVAAFRCRPPTLVLQTGLCWSEIVAAVGVLAHHVAQVGGRAVEVHVVTPDGLNQLGRRPHTNAPVAARVAAVAADLRTPIGLTCDTPKVAARSPPKLAPAMVFETSAHTMGTVVVAFVVAVART